MSSVQGPAKTPLSAPSAKSGPTCPECMSPFARKHPLQLFCSTTHRDVWNTRQAIRGRVATPLIVVARMTRYGTRGDIDTGKRAGTDINNLIQRWIEEDRAAGRMSWPEYLKRRYAIGFDPLT